MAKSSNIKGQMSWEEHDSSELLISGDPEAEIVNVADNIDGMLGSQSSGMLQNEDAFSVDLSPDSIEETLAAFGFSHDQCKVVADMPFSDRQRVMEQISVSMASNKAAISNNQSKNVMRDIIGGAGSIGGSVGSGVGSIGNADEVGDDISDMNNWVKGSLQDVPSFGKDGITAVYHAMSESKNTSNVGVTKWANFTGDNLGSNSTLGHTHFRGSNSDATQIQNSTNVSKLVKGLDASSSAKNSVVSRRSFSRLLGRALPGVTASGATTTGATTAAAAGGGVATTTGAGGGFVAAAVGIAGGVLVIALFIVIIFLCALATTGSNSSTGTLTGVEKEVAQALLDAGLTPVSAAAIMGNIYQESGFNASSIQLAHNCLAPNSYASCRGGHGLFQYEADGRFQALNSLAVERGVTWTNVKVQVDYMLSEVPEQFDTHSNTYYVYAEHGYDDADGISGIGIYMSFDDWKLLGETVDNLEWAVRSFEQVVERASLPRMSRRIEAAWSYYYAMTTTSTVTGNEIVDRAYECLNRGVLYVWGGQSWSGMDCSGLVSYCCTGHLGVHEYSTADIINWPRVSDPQPGDICVVHQSGGTQHTGVYIGNGQMIHTNHSGTPPKIADVYSSMVYVRYPY